MPGSVVASVSGDATGLARRFEGIDLAIVLPTLNEEEGLRRTYPELPIAALRGLGWAVQPLVIDGGSQDGTLAVAQGFDLPVLTQRGRGKGAAIQEALAWLAARRVSYAVVLDADCTYPGAAISPMVALLEAGSDLVVGVRYPATPTQGGIREAIHRDGNALLNLSASVLSHRPIIDLCSGLWGVRVAAATGLSLESRHFEVEAELFVKAARGGLTVSQIPIQYRQRVGEAKLRAFRDGVQIFLTLVRWSAVPSRIPRGSVPSSRFLRSVLAACFVHRAERAVLHVAPDRTAEGQALARGLRRGGVTPIVSPTPAAQAEDPFVGAAEVAEPGAPRTVVLTLPARPGGSSETPTALVHVGDRDRVVVVGAPVGRPPAWLGGLSGRGYHLDGSSAAPSLLAPLQAAHASITDRRPRQETALLRANAYHAPVRIYVRDPRRPPDRPEIRATAPSRADPEAAP